MTFSTAVKQSKPTTNSIDSLPIELEIQILDEIEDISTLSALIHASPAIHKIYVAHRSKILPQITLRTLKARGIVFTTAIDWAEVCFRTGKQYRKPCREEQSLLLFVFQSINRQLQSHSSTPMVFDVQQCLCLLKIAHMITYRGGDNTKKVLEQLESEELPAYSFLHVPDILEVSKETGYRIRSRTYPCGRIHYGLIVVRDFDPEQSGEVDTYTLVSHMIAAGEY